MKIIKILTDLLKAVEKNKTFTCNYSVDNNFIYYFPDGYRGYRIVKSMFLIDLEKALPNKTPLTRGKDLFNDTAAEDAIKTNEVRVIDKYNVIKIANEKNYAWVNTNYLKEFDNECTFKITNYKSPVYVYENEELVGLILPVRVSDK